MNGDIKIRLMTADDLDAVEAVEKRCFSCPWSKRSLAASLAVPVSIWLVAESEDAVTGFIGMVSVAGEAEILDLAVDIPRRRQGIARTLMKAAIDKAAADGSSTVFLDVRVSNIPAVRLYESFGFRVFTIRAGYYSDPPEDALGMRLDIKN